MKKEKKFFRTCPSCGKQVGHTSAAGRKLCEGKVCISCANRIKNTGIPHTAERRAALKKGLSSYKQSVNSAWTEMYGPKEVHARNYYRNWANEVKKRDNYTCKKCAKAKTGTHSIHAHHVCPKEYFPDKVLDVSNGISLCAKCHKQIHMQLDTYTLNGLRLDEAGFINHINEWKPNGPIKKRNNELDTERAERAQQILGRPEKYS